MNTKRSRVRTGNWDTFLLAGILAILFLTACTATSGAVKIVFLPTSSPAPVASAPAVPSEEKTISRISVIEAAIFYAGSATEHPQVGILEAGAGAQVIETREGNWMRIVCPDGRGDSCWVLWEPNSIYLYEGPAITLNIPDPASLKFETVSTETSPDGRWQAFVTRSEPRSLKADNTDPWFFYVELKVTSLEDGKTWIAVSEWHAAGLGQDEPPELVHWSKDGRFLYYTSLAYPDGACVFYDNIGSSFDRLDLTDGSVEALEPPHARGLLAISPDEAMIAYLPSETFQGDRSLVVRNLDSAYGGDASQDSVKWQVPLEVAWPNQVSEIAWSPDNTKVIVRVTQFADYCQPPASIEHWELDVNTGDFARVSTTVLPTATP